MKNHDLLESSDHSKSSGIGLVLLLIIFQLASILGLLIYFAGVIGF